jgi:hypothetical protein
MSERESKLIIPSPENILTSEEAELLQRADRGEFTCLTWRVTPSREGDR